MSWLGFCSVFFHLFTQQVFIRYVFISGTVLGNWMQMKNKRNTDPASKSPQSSSTWPWALSPVQSHHADWGPDTILVSVTPCCSDPKLSAGVLQWKWKSRNWWPGRWLPCLACELALCWYEYLSTSHTCLPFSFLDPLHSLSISTWLSELSPVWAPSGLNFPHQLPMLFLRCQLRSVPPEEWRDGRIKSPSLSWS